MENEDGERRIAGRGKMEDEDGERRIAGREKMADETGEEGKAYCRTYRDGRRDRGKAIGWPLLNDYSEIHRQECRKGKIFSSISDRMAETREDMR